MRRLLRYMEAVQAAIESIQDPEALRLAVLELKRRFDAGEEI